MSKIQKLEARQILDSRGNPTLAVDCYVDGHKFSAAVPSGASTGIHEAHELRDNAKAFHGKGVSKAVRNVAVISKYLKGMSVENQKAIDSTLIELDGTEHKSRLGANAMLGVSLAVAKAGAGYSCNALYYHIASMNTSKRISLPVPFFNVINGGRHAGNKLCVQEFMIAPVGAKSFSEAMRMGSEIYQSLKTLIKKKYSPNAINVGDEGGFAPSLSKTKEALQLLDKVLHQTGYTRKVKIGMDVAASEFFSKGKYHFDAKSMSASKLGDALFNFAQDYSLISIEDPFDQEDFSSFADLTYDLRKKCQIVGDDLLVTNLKRIRMGLHHQACSALLLKVNQIGTLTEAMAAAQLVKMYDWNVMVSHRSGETTDTFIADLAVGINCGQIKSGAPCRGERVAKYNRLLEIEHELGRKAKYARFHL